MSTDIQLPFAFAETGDTTTVSGRTFYEQHAAILAVEGAVDTAGGPLTADERVEITSQLERVYDASPYFTSPVSVAVQQEGRGDETLQLRVELGDGTTFDVPVDERDVTST